MVACPAPSSSPCMKPEPRCTLTQMRAGQSPEHNLVKVHHLKKGRKRRGLSTGKQSTRELEEEEEEGAEGGGRRRGEGGRRRRRKRRKGRGGRRKGRKKQEEEEEEKEEKEEEEEEKERGEEEEDDDVLPGVLAASERVCQERGRGAHSPSVKPVPGPCPDPNVPA